MAAQRSEPSSDLRSFLLFASRVFLERRSLSASHRGWAFMTDSSTHNYLRPIERCRLVLSTFQAPLVLQLISESYKDIIVNVFPALLLHQTKKHTTKPWIQTPDSGAGPHFFQDLCTSSFCKDQLLSWWQTKDWLHQVRAELCLAQNLPRYQLTTDNFGRT